MAVVATGFFDGVHLGHRQVIDTLVSFAHEKGEEAVVVTFAQHPRAVLQQDPRKLRLLTSRAEKTMMLEAMGVDRVEVLPFTRELASLTASRYIREILVERLGASAVVLGYDNRFGSDRLGLEEIAGLVREEGLEVITIPPFSAGEKVLSSTKIRAMLERGDVEAAAGMLGYSYTLIGVVVPGKQLGRTIGFPTANLRIVDPLKQIPGRGVYVTRTEVLGKEYLSMTNVGDIVETNIFDFDSDIYSLEIHLRFIRRLRDMMAFSGLDELRRQLGTDKEIILKSME